MGSFSCNAVDPLRYLSWLDITTLRLFPRFAERGGPPSAEGAAVNTSSRDTSSQPLASPTCALGPH